MATNDDWLARTVEPALEPELPICDPHHHLWDFRPLAPRGLSFEGWPCHPPGTAAPRDKPAVAAVVRTGSLA